MVRITPIYKPKQGLLEGVPQPQVLGTYSPWFLTTYEFWEPILQVNPNTSLDTAQGPPPRVFDRVSQLTIYRVGRCHGEVPSRCKQWIFRVLTYIYFFYLYIYIYLDLPPSPRMQSLPPGLFIYLFVRDPQNNFT